MNRIGLFIVACLLLLYNRGIYAEKTETNSKNRDVSITENKQINQNRILTLNPNESVIYNEYVSYWEDPTGEADFATARNQNFQPVPNDKPEFGFSSNTIWFRILIRKHSSPSATASYYIVMDYPVLDSVDFYKLQDGYLQTLYSGDKLPFANRSIQHRLINWEIPLDQKSGALSIQEIYFRVKTSSSFQAGGFIASESTYQDSIIRENVGLGFYYGAIFLLIIYNAILFLFLQDRSYIIYSVFLSFYLVFQMIINGTFYSLILPNHPQFVNFLLLISLLQAMTWAVIFPLHFLQIEKGTKRIKLLYTNIVYGFMLTALSFVLPYKLIIALAVPLGVGFPISLLIVGVSRFREGYKPAKYFLIAWSFFLVSIVIFALKTASILPSNWFTNYVMQIGSFIEATFLSLALAYKLNMIRVENQNKSERLKNYSEQLEEMIKSRTQELESTVTKLESARSELIDTEKKSSLTQLAAGLAHELNNPMNYISAGLPNLRKEVTKLEDVFMEIFDYDGSTESIEYKEVFMKKFTGFRNIFQSLDYSVRRTEGLIKEVRGLTEVDGSISSRIDIKQLIRKEVITVRRNLLEEGFKSKIRIRFILSSKKKPILMGNPFTVSRIVRNILTNAMFYAYESKQEAQVIIRVHWTEDSRLISIANNGPPIADSDLEDLIIESQLSNRGMEAESRTQDAKKSQKRKPGGLSIAYNLSQNISSHIRLTDNGQESGWVEFTWELQD